jgi:hypothetical protein
MTQPQKNSNQAAQGTLANPSKVLSPSAAAPERVFRVVDPDHALVPGFFTERELFQLRNACRDSDNENAIRFLNAALARAESK